MSLALILMIIEFIALLACAAFFSGTETAITAITGVQYKMLKKNRSKKNKRTIELIKKKEEIVSATLIGTNFVNTLSSALVTAFVIDHYGDEYLFYATAISTLMIIIFAEIVPKAFATYRPVEMTRNSSLILYFLRLILKPLLAVFSFMSNGIIGLVSKGNRGNNTEMNEDYLKTLISISFDDGTFQQGEHDLIKRAVQLHELKLDGIMTTHEKIVGVDIDSSLEEIIEVFRESKFSRLPVFNPETNHIEGLLHYKDILFYIKAKADKYDGADIAKYDKAIKSSEIKSLIRPTIFIPTTANIFSALNTMSKNKKNMAFVIDEYGSCKGLITIDDISTAIFGSIQDEYAKQKENPSEEMRVIDPEHIRIPADMPLVKLNEIFACNFNSIYNNTLGGLILEKLEYLPKEGDIVQIAKVNFKIEKVESSRIIFVVAELNTLMYRNKKM